MTYSYRFILYPTNYLNNFGISSIIDSPYIFSSAFKLEYSVSVITVIFSSSIAASLSSCTADVSTSNASLFSFKSLISPSNFVIYFFFSSIYPCIFATGISFDSLINDCELEAIFSDVKPAL